MAEESLTDGLDHDQATAIDPKYLAMEQTVNTIPQIVSQATIQYNELAAEELGLKLQIEDLEDKLKIAAEKRKNIFNQLQGIKLLQEQLIKD